LEDLAVDINSALKSIKTEYKTFSHRSGLRKSGQNYYKKGSRLNYSGYRI
jgi:hypothetical protein